jgi:hypothetical protein
VKLHCTKASAATLIVTALLVVESSCTHAQTGVTNVAQGSITVDGKKTELRHSYTYAYRTLKFDKDVAETLLILSDKPLPPDAVIDKLDRLSAKDKDNIQMIEVTFSDAKEIEVVQFRIDGFSTTAFASAFKATFEAFGAKSQKGRLTTVGEQKSFSNKYTLDVRFDATATVPRTPDAIGKKAWESAQGKVLAAYLLAVHTSDKAGIKRNIVPEAAKALDSPDAERAMKAMKMFAANPKGADIEGLFVIGDTAKVKLVELVDGRKSYTSKNLRRVGDVWLVAP